MIFPLKNVIQIKQFLRLNGNNEIKNVSKAIHIDVISTRQRVPIKRERKLFAIHYSTAAVKYMLQLVPAILQLLIK